MLVGKLKDEIDLTDEQVEQTAMRPRFFAKFQRKRSGQGRGIPAGNERILGEEKINLLNRSSKKGSRPRKRKRRRPSFYRSRLGLNQDQVSQLILF
jgi:hypothetical protein